jgi:hypothetical protein
LTDGSLVLVIDAIPWAVAHEVWGEGHLPGFSEPVPSVSVFPSFTNVAVPALVGQILGTRPPGYEARYYHPPSGTIRGGLITAEVDRHLAQYRIRPVGPLGMVAGFLVPQLMARGEVLRLINGFVKQGGHWLAYAAATDSVAHFSGREALTAAFRNVILRIVDARRTLETKHGTAPAVVLTSDHGMAFGPLANVSDAEVGEALERAGFVRESPGPNGFFLPAMGEVAAGVCFVAPDRAVMAARILTRLDGIDVVIARRSEESALIVRGADEATLEWRDGRCRYLANPADPLSYAPLLAELQRGGAVDAQGFVDTDGLLTASLRHDYPDALHRIRRALTDLVDFPAPVVFSMRPGFTYGPRLTHVAAAILGGQVGTHGALSSEQSIGFLSVAGLPAPPPVVRAETALVPYRDLVIQGARSS